MPLQMNPIAASALVRGEPSAKHAMPLFGPARVQETMGLHVRQSRGALAEKRRATDIYLFHGVPFRSYRH
jgi:hypothetical protein